MAQENILQLLPDAVVPSREELCTYWKTVADDILAYLGRRPLKLVRHVKGTTLYHMGPLPEIPPAVHQLHLEKRKAALARGYGLRTWQGYWAWSRSGSSRFTRGVPPSTTSSIPTCWVFDLDPGEGVEWDFVVDTAFRLRDKLAAEGHDCWPKTTGGKGLHVMVPIKPAMEWDAAHAYTRHIAEELAATAPDRYENCTKRLYSPASARPGCRTSDAVLPRRSPNAEANSRMTTPTRPRGQDENRTL